ncbi:restriction system protein [Cnuella takakiae]|uniref:Restriction system protein n=1 Tax=Cnuella takakiae TaxID=1302690 RepID=A0A1M4TML2_9BACT|nr:restriction endonuclease [Cnuella takakiae]OLY90763.1 hypothetical protein BUE76_01750 [Cnuella takakiae]SHE45527.1 restriction system protein [Cnuella takakiae]
MSANKIPDFQSIMLPLLKHLGDGQPHTLSEVIASLATVFKLTEEDLAILVPSGQQRLFKNRVTWAITYLKNAGLLYYPQRAVYQITESGKKVIEAKTDNINLAYLKSFDAYKKWQGSFSQPADPAKPTLEPSSNTPEEVIGVTIGTINEKLSLELLELLKSKPADYFEFFVLRLLSKMGYGGVNAENFEVVGKSGDNGIDGIIYQDQLGIDRVYVQAKRWSDAKVQSKDVRDFIGSLSLRGTNKGIFITTSEFTADAIKTVQMNPQNRIILIDGKQLAEYAITYNVGVQIKTVYQVKALDNDFFDDL